MAETSPFSLGQIDILDKAKRKRDHNLVYQWTSRAIKHHEDEKNRLIKLIDVDVLAIQEKNKELTEAVDYLSTENRGLRVKADRYDDFMARLRAIMEEAE